MIKICSSILRIICTILYPLNSNIIPCNILLKKKDIEDTLKTFNKKSFFPEAKPNKQVKRAYVSTYSILWFKACTHEMTQEIRCWQISLRCHWTFIQSNQLNNIATRLAIVGKNWKVPISVGCGSIPMNWSFWISLFRVSILFRWRSSLFVIVYVFVMLVFE